MPKLVQTVFISSTKDDLGEYRIAARDIVLALDCFPIMMDYFPSTKENAIEICKRKVNESDIFVGIYAHRYGFCPKGSDISITEMEFDWASENKDRLCFIVDPVFPWNPELVEAEPGRTKLKDFKKRIETTVTRRTFTYPDNLMMEIAKSLHNILNIPATPTTVGKFRVVSVSQPIPYRPSKSMTFSTPKVNQIFFIEDNIETFDQYSFRDELSIATSIDVTEIEIVQVSQGSVVVHVVLPHEAADVLYGKIVNSKAIQMDQLQEDTNIEFYSCYISYSHTDKEFAMKLYEILSKRGIRCWLDEHQMLLGDDILVAINQGIRLWDKVLLCCSKASLTSWWVDHEIEQAFNKEHELLEQTGNKVLAIIPLDLDGFLFDGYESAKGDRIRSRLVANFNGWETDNSIFEREINKLIRSLQN